jgi:hypothetical protein
MPAEAAVVVTFDPHVGAAIVCLLLAIVAAVMALVFGLAENEERRK